MFATQSAKDRVAVLVAELESNDPQRRFGAVRALGEGNNPRAAMALMMALTHEDYLVRCAAACALGQLKDRRAITALTNRLRDSEAIVRQEVAGALGEIGRGRPDIRSATLEPQVAALQDPDPAVRKQIATNLGDSGQGKWIGVLADILTGDSDCEVRLAAAEGLGNIGKRQAVEPLIRALEADRDDYVRQAAAEGLGRIRDKRIVAPLATALVSDTCSRVRAAAACAAVRVPHKRMQAPLRAALHDDNAIVRTEAAGALDRLIARRVVRHVVMIFTTVIGSYVAVLAMSLIGSILSERIETQKDLRAVVVQEAQKLGLNPDRVECRLRAHFEGRIWLNRSSGIALLEVGGLGANRIGVRHELYHLARGHLEQGGHTWGFSNDSALGNCFIEEPQAIVYSCTGLKL